MSNRSLELKTQKPLQIFTLAHAVRPTKRASQAKTIKMKQSFNIGVFQQIKEALKVKHEPAIHRQPKSHLPMRMIVSKITARKPATEDCNHTQDISVRRCIELAPPSWRTVLEPPSWRNKLWQTKRLQTCQMQRIVENMKEKCAPLNSTLQHRPAALKNGQRNLDMENLVCKNTHQDCNPLTTPQLDFNYNQLYRASHQSLEIKQISSSEGEDPLDFDDLGTPQVEQHSTESEKGFESSSDCSFVQEQDNKSEAKFVWNPVIVYDTPKRHLSRVHNTLNCESSRDHYTYSFNSDSSLHHPRFVQEQQSHFEIQSPRGCWESDSTSSDQTIAEERLLLTYLKKRCRPTSYNSSHGKKSCLPETGIQLTKNSKSLQVDDRSAIFKFHEE